MKHLIVAAAVAVLLVTGLAAQAEKNELVFRKVYQMTSFDIHPDSFNIPKRQYLDGAEISIDERSKFIKVTFYQSLKCPRNQACITLFLERKVERILPVTYMGSPFCGGSIIVAKSDLRPADGDFFQVSIHDNNGNICQKEVENIVHVAITEQAALRFEYGPEIHSSMEGFKLLK